MALPQIRGPGLAETIYISRAKRQGQRSDEASRRVRVSAEILSKLFHLPTREAALKLGICPTTFKKTCRRLGIPHWPYHKGFLFGESPFVFGHYSCCSRSPTRSCSFAERFMTPSTEGCHERISREASATNTPCSSLHEQSTPLPDCIKEILDYLDTAHSIDLVSIKRIVGSSADEDEDHECVSEPETLAVPVLLRAE